ncbi:MAG: ParB/RepB/Spo0J family partition protein [Lentisphaerae bacterium]|nr:ParB/RepB/Spo0J family partition protein [Lentisphaerota bacterium]
MATKPRLGRGLGNLLKDDNSAQAAQAGGEPPRLEQLSVPIDSIVKNPFQPRKLFDAAALDDLAASIREHGVLQPLLVRRLEKGGYELIAGERRLKASGMAGLKEVPVRVRDADDKNSLEVSLIENLQREGLNPIEEADGYRMLSDRFGLTQEEIAARVGKGRATVANAVRLLDLQEEIREMIRRGRLSAGHAKVLLGVVIDEERLQLARRAAAEDIPVRTLAAIVERLRRAPRKPRAIRPDVPAAHLNDLIERLHRHFGTAIRMSPCRTLSNGRKMKGTLEIDYYSNDELNRVLGIIGLPEGG